MTEQDDTTGIYNGWPPTCPVGDGDQFTINLQEQHDDNWSVVANLDRQMHFVSKNIDSLCREALVLKDELKPVKPKTSIRSFFGKAILGKK